MEKDEERITKEKRSSKDLQKKNKERKKQVIGETQKRNKRKEKYQNQKD